jgi:hypothetical protein
MSDKLERIWKEAIVAYPIYYLDEEYHLLVTPCSPLKVNRRFEGTYRLYLQDRKKIRAKTSMKAGGKQRRFGGTYGLHLQAR